jgi:hypothetical protein
LLHSLHSTSPTSYDPLDTTSRARDSYL